jgi:UDP:flavonoid glycosyltransferase YjiC (YdhE family)
MKILLAAFGTRGDVQPMVALGSRLRSEGHDVTIGASPGFASWVIGHGLSFHGIGLDIEPWTRAHPELVHDPLRAIAPVIRYLRDDLELAMEHTLEAAHGTDLIVSGIHAAAASVAERLGLPHRTLLLCPQMIPSRQQPPPGIPWFDLPQNMNRACWGAFRLGMNVMLRDRLNRQRRSWGLASVNSVLDHLSPPNAIVASDAALGELPTDAPASLVQTGSMEVAGGEALEPALEEFLGRGAPPIYIGFGSMPDADAARTTRVLFQALRASGRRAVMLSGWAGLGTIECPSEVFVARAVPHGRLLPRVALAVHHGGAGTTAAAARAGVPQIVVPHIADQFYWGHRVFALGIGTRPIPRHALTAGALRRSIATIARRPSIAERAREVAAMIARTDGLAAVMGALNSAATPAGSRAAA